MAERARPQTAPVPVSKAPRSTAPMSVTDPTSQKMPLAIRWVYPVGEPQVTELSQPVTRFGRETDNDVVLDGAAISRHHAEVERRGNALAIRDLGSRNGVFCDGAQVRTAPLTLRTVLRLGDWVGVLAPVSDHRTGIWEAAPDLWGSLAIDAAVQEARRIAPSSLSALIVGETGTGKELAARAVHLWSGRTGAFVPVNCAALSDSLLEAELFGHERGAFTGAQGVRRGHVREADRGTLFLDEVAELSLNAQAKLLRVLQEHEVTPVGSSDRIPVDLRVVSATHRNLQQMVEAGGFRRDLYARLEGVTLRLPPLRERREDVVDLFVYFVERIANRPCRRFTARFAEQLACHQWSRNVRELRHTAERISVLHGGLSEWRSRHLRVAHPEMTRQSIAPNEMKVTPMPPQRVAPGQVGRSELEAALRAVSGNVVQAARSLGMSKQTLYKLIHVHGVELEALRGAGGD